ncbi:hypothetical protein CEE69_12885 [Rhodopirellula bahusiensis]|uniref:Core-binding (CB) domain-containing protein n=2 Tax=Rhodopirellula bahusiensis TaxID=2014065 RepID=A0A2G1W6X5_9BACT|nr:hypothetical protein CEE69_12885 [Rhodopirellula bahusiensis]
MNSIQLTSLHETLDAYSDFITQRSAASPASAAKRINVIRRLKEFHTDLPLTSLGHGEIQSMVDHWRSRPAAKTSGKPIAYSTAAKHISELRRFLIWLHENPEASWSIPSNLLRLNTQPVRIDSDFRNKGQSLRRYSIDELRVLYQHAREDERLIFLFGLNCGFGAAEMGLLKVKDFHLKSQNSHPLNEERGSVLILHRPNTNHVGVWQLWPETVHAFEVLMEREGQIGGHVFNSRDGESLYRQTSRNPSSAFANLWRRLTNRVSEQHLEFPLLPIKMLRGTAMELLMPICPGDAVRAYLGHRPDHRDLVYGKLDGRLEAEACQLLREMLEPVFVDRTN